MALTFSPGGGRRSLSGMALKATLFLGCDAGRAPNCEHRVDGDSVRVADLARATARLREQARDQAWAREQHGDRELDVCSACTRFSWATGYEGIGPPPAPPVLPAEESWVSATDDWLRRQAAKAEEQARLEQAQHQPGESFR